MKVPNAVAVLGMSAVAAALGVVSPAVAQQTTSAILDTSAAINSSDLSLAAAKTTPPGQIRKAPAPLIAGGIPGLLALGGAYLVVRRRRRRG